MAKEKRSFFERLTGGVAIEDDFDDDILEEKPVPAERSERGTSSWEQEEEDPGIEGHLTVDVHQTPTHVIIKTMVAGVRPDDLDVAITRDMVTIKGKRESQHETGGEDYFLKELYWGAFSRTIMLPAEVEVDSAEASERHGLLTIRIPKVNKDRQTKLKIKTV